MRRSAWPFLVLVAVLLPASVADGFEGPPRAQLQGNGQVERIGAWAYEWQSPSGPDGCEAIAADGFPKYDQDLVVAHAHAHPRVVFMRDHRPRVGMFRAYSHLDEDGLATANGKRVRFQVQPKLKGGEVVAWVIPFRVNVAERPYFNLSVNFRGRGRCDQGGGGSYAFGIIRGA